MVRVNLQQGGGEDLERRMETAAENREEVLITFRNGETARFVPLPRPKPRFGSARGLIKMSDDFDEPLEDFEEHMP